MKPSTALPKLLLGALVAIAGCAPPTPQPQTAGPSAPPNCAVPTDAANLTAVTPATTGGVFRVPSGGFTLPAATTLTLTSSLIIIVRDELRIDGAIQIGSPAVAGSPIDVVLVSTNGDVSIGGHGGRCGLFQPNPPATPAATATAPDALAAGVAGDNAGFIKVVAGGG